MRSIQVIKATGNPADVAASLWKTYINGGLTSQFLTDLLRLKKSSTNISGRPSSEFQSFVQGGLQQLLNEKEIKDVSEKILLGCLTAIKGVHFKSQASYAVEDLILASADIVTRSLCNLTESQRVIVSRALNSLLSNKQPVAVLERLFQQELFHSRLDHDVTSPYPFVRERIGNRMSSNQGNSGKKGKSGKFQQRDLSPSFTEPSSENNFKIVSLLTFKSYESFPFLMKLPVADDVWKAYIKDLKDAGHRLCVVK